MEKQNMLGDRIDVAADMIRYDNACKQVLSNKVILAWIMKYCLKEYKDFEIGEIMTRYIEGEPEISTEAVHRDERAEFIEGLNTEDVSITEGTTRYDIKFKAVYPRAAGIKEMILNIESQKEASPGYPIVKRGIYYNGRMLSAQYGTVFTRSHYEKLNKVCSIWLCTESQDERAGTITCYEYAERNIYGAFKEDAENYDIASVVMVCLVKNGEKSGHRLVDMLSVLFSQEMDAKKKKEELAKEYGIPMTLKMECEVENMCNLSVGVFESGYNKGYGSGYDTGYGSGYDTGYDSGYGSGYDTGVKEQQEKYEAKIADMEAEVKELKERLAEATK